MEISTEYKKKVLDALMEVRKNFTGSDSAFSKQWGINAAVYSRMKNGETEEVLNGTKWITMGRELGVSTGDRKWKTARTDVFTVIEQDILFCKEYSKSQIFVDACGIGKSYTARYLSRTTKNCFYVDASQSKTKNQFIRLMAKTIGVDAHGRLIDILSNIKYYLKMLPKPVVIIDEAGDLNYEAFLTIKELWNATEGACGWYMMGADGLRAKIERGISCRRVGYREIFSRFSEKYSKIVPAGKDDQAAFYKKLINDVLTVNCEDTSVVPGIISRCLVRDSNGEVGGLRRAESLLILNS
jgi:hypothetical protein